MVKDITLNDLVALLYNDLDREDAVEMRKIVLTDKALLRQYLGFRRVKHGLSKKRYSPSQNTINAVLLNSRTPNLA